MATWSVARIFTNSIFSAALGNMSKFGSALACTKISLFTNYFMSNLSCLLVYLFTKIVLYGK